LRAPPSFVRRPQGALRLSDALLRQLRQGLRRQKLLSVEPRH
jgi:hypothetical protein